MSVIGYVLLIAAFVGVYALLVFLSLRFCCRDDVSFPVDDSDDEEDEIERDPQEKASVSLPLMADEEGEEEEEEEEERPSLDWRNRATVIPGTGRRLRVVRSREDLKEVPPLHDADRLGDLCPRGEAVPSEDVMPPEGA